jgi:DEAD/DEAH box helicase domain-containing protein
VVELDLPGRRVRVERVDVDWYTSPLAEKETEILEELETISGGGLRGGSGRLRVTERTVGFERRRSQGLDVLDRQSLDLPPVVSEPHGLWIAAPAGAAARTEARGDNLLGSLHALEHAAIGLLPSLVLCDRNDLGGISLAVHPQLGGPGIFVYEAHAGGVGIARRALRELPELLRRVEQLLDRCPCESGCPACVQSPKCGNGNRPLDKAGALELSRDLLAAAEGYAVAPAAARPNAAPDSGGATPARQASPRAPRSRRVAADAPVPRRPAEAEAARRDAGDAGGGTVLFDVETLRSAAEVGGWGKAHRMGVAVAVALYLEEGRFETFLEPEVPRLVTALKSARLVVGFNSRRFDYAVLSGYTGEDYARTLPTLDLLETLHAQLGFRVGLGHVAQETLGTTKSADGLQSLEWVKAGELERVADYCRRDVEILRDVYLFGRREGHVVVSTRGGRVRVPVDW